MKNRNVLRREQLDARLSDLAHARTMRPPRQGWIRTIREGLGMSLRQLAERVGTTKSAVAALERREAEGRITLDSLARVAEGLESELVYFVIPRRTLEDTVRRRALELAERLAETVDDTMALEMQRTTPGQRKRLVQSLAEELLQSEATLWDE